MAKKKAPKKKPAKKKVTKKTQARRILTALVTVVVPLLVGVGLGTVYASPYRFRPPLTAARPHDYQAALKNVLELQSLALSEANAGRRAFFASHIGCADPPVWQDERVLQNFKRMVQQGVEVKLLAGLTDYFGRPLPAAWPKQFAAKLKEEELDGIGYAMLPRELPNHSVVAGSPQECFAYICYHEEDGVYPTKYFRVYDYGLCEAWYDYLVTIFRQSRKRATRPNTDG